MSLLPRYLWRTIWSISFGVIAGLSALVYFITFMGEADDIGTGGYHLVTGMVVILLRMPEVLYEMIPIAFLIGTILGIGQLASRSELIAMQACGLSRHQLALRASVSALPGVLLCFIIGELWLPWADTHADIVKEQAISGKITTDTRPLWIRHENSFISVAGFTANHQILHGVEIFQFNQDLHLKQIISAQKARFGAQRWDLYQVQQVDFEDERIRHTYLEQAVWFTELNPDLLSVLSVPSALIPWWQLGSYIAYLEENHLDNHAYRISYWDKLAHPLSTLFLVWLGVPFVFVSSRSGGIGQRSILGIMTGMAYYIFNAIFKSSAQVYHLNPFVSAWASSIMLFALGYLLLRRKH